MKNKKPSLADKISNLITAAPTNFGSDDDEENETKAKIVDEYDESDTDDNNSIRATNSSIRKSNLDLLDKIDNRYRGKKIRKKDIYGSDNSDDDLNDDDEDDNHGINEHSDESDAEGSFQESNDDDDDDDDDDNDKDEGEDESDDDNDGSDSDENSIDDENPLYRNRQDDFRNITTNNLQDDREKGNCVREQLKIWENLLEMRIQLQKCLISSNKLPQFDIFKRYQANDEFVKIENQTKNKLTNLLNNMLQVQDKLLKNYPETKKLSEEMTNKNIDNEAVKIDPMDEEILSDTDDETGKIANIDNNDSDNEVTDVEPAKKRQKTLTEYENILNDNHLKFTPYRNSVIQLWNDKTRVASGNINNKATNQSILKQIEFILSDKSKIIRKTQLKRSDYDIIGKTVTNDINDMNNRRNQEYDTEIYDDDDFYHQLLRELIQHKSADITDPIQLSKQWIQLQSMRDKMKRKVNTKESKGRRIRYTQVHNKLVNFMAPITKNDTWSSLAKTELYNSLFGKIQSQHCNINDKNVINNE